MDLLDAALQAHSITEVANALGICNGTVRRWKELNSVPAHYRFDLLRLLGREINYAEFTFKEKDQFFTPRDIAQECWNAFRETVTVDLDEYTFIEPSAGDGSFLSVLPESTIAMDVEPRHERIQKQDYLQWRPTDTATRYIVFGNPPFGLRGHLALQFINHSAEFADYVCFILPQLFESDGKGAPRKRVVGYNLIYSKKLTGSFHMPDSTQVEVNGVFQIWAKHETNPEYTLAAPNREKLTVYSLSDGGSPSTTRNKDKIGVCDVYLPSTCFGKEAMRTYTSFEDLPNRKGYGIVFHQDRERLIARSQEIDWSKVGFLSTNSAFNLRTSIICAQF